MQTVNRLARPARGCGQLARARATVALVPTMGALHEGHLTLVREARKQAPAVVVSIFVNPTQFGPNEDLAAYPRQLAEDARLLEAEGVDLLWAPPVEEVYPEGFATTVSVAGLERRPVRRLAAGAFRRGGDGGRQAVRASAARPRAVRREGLAAARGDPPHGARPRPDAAARRAHPRRADGARGRRPRDVEPQPLPLAGGPRPRRRAADRDAQGDRGDRGRRATSRWCSTRQGPRCWPAASPASTMSSWRMRSRSSRSAQLGERPARLFVAARIGGTRLIDNMAVAAPRA